jgi:DNA-binding transcriptional LysR family regulator
MNDRFTLLKVFVRVARAGSFSAAAREMGMPQPTVSRLVAALERKVGVALLTRSTRAVALTEAGANYLGRSEAILAAIDEADHAARGTGELRGTLRVATSHGLAVRTLLPRLSRFAAQHPKLRMEFTLGDAPHDLIGESIDVAVRVGMREDSSLVRIKVGTAHRVVVASPDYLARSGTPTTPSELSGHAIIVGPAGHAAEGWTFRKGDKTGTVRVEGRFIIGTGEAAAAAAVAGLGVLSTGHRGVQAELHSGALVRLLSDWEMAASDISVLLPAGRAAKPSARAFATFVAEEIRAMEAETPWDAAPRQHSSRRTSRPTTVDSRRRRTPA